MTASQDGGWSPALTADPPVDPSKRRGNQRYKSHDDKEDKGGLRRGSLRKGRHQQTIVKDKKQRRSVIGEICPRKPVGPSHPRGDMAGVRPNSVTMEGLLEAK